MTLGKFLEVLSREYKVSKKKAQKILALILAQVKKTSL